MTEPMVEAPESPELWEIPRTCIEPNPCQPRQVFDEAELAELANSIRQHGIIQPLIVMSNGQPNHFYLIAGERRWRAAGLIDLPVLPCIVRPAADARAQTELALIENVQRADLSVAEEGRAYKRLMDDFGLSDEEIARRVGKATSTIRNILRLQILPESVLGRVGSGAGQIPQGTARQLVALAKIAPKAVEATANDMLAAQDQVDAERTLSRAMADKAIRLEYGWADVWPETPLMTTDTAGEIAIAACAGCPSFVKVGHTPYCTDKRCYAAKTHLFATAELARVSKKLKVPIAQPDEKVEVLAIDFQASARAKAWLSGKTRPDHLRLVSAVGVTKQRFYYMKEVVGSDAVLLASTDPAALTRRETPPSMAPADETPAQKTKRLEREEAERAERRIERALARQAKWDVSWLALHTAAVVAPQITASGATLSYLSDFVSERVRPNGHWPEVEEALAALSKKLDQAKAQAEREALQREMLLLNLIFEKGSAYDPKHTYDWDRLVEKLIDLGDADNLGLKLPKGWAQAPIHHTDSNCWACGVFTSNDHITKIDEEAGWQVSADGVVTCSDGCRKKAPKGKAAAPATKPAKNQKK